MSSLPSHRSVIRQSSVEHTVTSHSRRTYSAQNIHHESDEQVRAERIEAMQNIPRHVARPTTRDSSVERTHIVRTHSAQNLHPRIRCRSGERRLSVPMGDPTMSIGTTEEEYTGTVITLKEGKRIGFIKPARLPANFVRKDVFFHFDSIRGRSLKINDAVTFKLQKNSADRPSCFLIRHIDEDASVFLSRRSHDPSSPSQQSCRSGRVQSSSRSSNASDVQASMQSQHIKSDNSAQPVLDGGKRKRSTSIDDPEELHEMLSQNNEGRKVAQASAQKKKNRSQLLSQKTILPVAEVYSTKKQKPGQLTGRIVSLIKNKIIGFVKPSKVPDGYPTEGDVMFLVHHVQCGHIDLIEGDTLGFTLGVKDKDRPMAFSTQLKLCAPRPPALFLDWINRCSQILRGDSESTTNRGSYALQILSCNAIWEGLGELRNPSDELICHLIQMLLFIDAEFQGLKSYLKTALCTLAYSPFFDPWKGPMKLYTRRCFTLSSFLDLQDELCHFFTILIQSIPQKARVVVLLLKTVISATQNPREIFLYTILREISHQCCGEIEDMEWNEVPLVPGPSELTGEGYDFSSNLRPVQVTGSYESAVEYMDTYFRLLRADCFGPLGKGISDFLKGKLDHRDMNMYCNVHVMGIHFTPNGMAIALQVTPYRPVRDWKVTTKLMFGNLLCLTTSGTFTDPIWATVVNRNTLPKHQIVMVELVSECNTMADSDAILRLHSMNGNIIMAESPTYYRAYQPVLKTLQQMDPETIPFFEELVTSKQGGPPQYITNCPEAEVNGDIIYSQVGKINILTMALEECSLGTTTLDASQESAIKQALINRIAIIQGPPGTGKTFIGIKLVKLLLSCKQRPPGPILLLTYKNHALDEFLMGLLNEGIMGIMRVGGRSKEEGLEKYNINEIRREKRMQDSLFRQWVEVKNAMDEAKNRVEKTFGIMKHARLLTNKQLLESLTATQLKQLVQGSLQSKKYSQNVAHDLLCSEDGLKFATEALSSWMPDMTTVNTVEAEIKTCVKNYHTFTLKHMKQNENDDELHDETDVKRLQEERMLGLTVSTVENKKIMEELHLLDNPQKSPRTLLDGMLQTAKNEPIHILRNVDNIWALHKEERVKFVQSKIIENFETASATFEEELAEYELLCEEKRVLEEQHRGQLVSQVDVIGMTITGASVHRCLLEYAHPPIVVVEEAAEVLEPQLLAVLGKWVQHLILIGDHKQLRPPVESYTLQKDFHFDVSLMERLIKNNFPFATLMMQNRMRPEFADLLLDIYPHLQSNLARVQNNPVPNCCGKSMFFWDHDHEETSARSFTNEEEAERAVNLSLFFLRQGYKPRHISILGAYQGQVALIRRKLKIAKQVYPDCFETETAEKNDNETADESDSRVDVMTIDMFQGDENDIIIVSLVRCNKQRQAGFLKLLNRRCVAQSRAKSGMYIIGNTDTMNETPWSKIITKMKEIKCVGKLLPLQCPRHPDTSVVSALNSKTIPFNSFCKSKCLLEMPCGKHNCKKTCQPPHQHTRCIEKVQFQFKYCKHTGEKLCFQSEERQKCTEIIRNEMLPCRHLGDRHCYEKPEEVVCKKVCLKPLPCHHLCQMLCVQPCNPKFCHICAQIHEKEAEMEKKRQEKLLEEMKKGTEAQIKMLEKEDTSVKSVELHPYGDTASEYLSVEDKVKLYIRPDHQWFPNIKKIEKVKNVQLEVKWLQRKLKLHDPQRVHESKFHGTAAADMIIEKGFRLPKQSGQMFGPGIYFASDSSKSAQEIYTKGKKTLLLCDVLVGKTKTLTSADQDMNLQKLKSQGYDSIFAKRDSSSTGGVRFDEYVVYNADQALPRYIIRYETVDVPDDLATLRLDEKTSGQLQKHSIVAEREFDVDDTMQIHYRIAESQVLRLLQNNPSSAKVKNVDYYINPPLVQTFRKTCDEFSRKYPGKTEGKPVLAFHGTAKENIDSIVKNNFSLGKIKRGAYGWGIYFSEFPGVSLGYGDSLLLCKVLPGRSYDCSTCESGSGLKPGYDSHRVRKDNEGRGEMLVIFDASQILPCYVVHLG